jgi:hypothetical protein
LRDDEERAEARRALSFLQSLRQAIPASLDDSDDTKDAFQKYESELIAKANGTPPAPKKRRYTASKRQKK